MTDSVSAFLADRLSELDATALGDVAHFANVDLKVARRAASGEPVAASDALKLLAARGYDPITRKVIDPRQIGALSLLVMGLGIRGRMIANKHTVRAAAKVMGVSPTAVARLRAGNPVSINIIVPACAYLGIHPFEQCEPMRQAA